MFDHCRNGNYVPELFDNLAKCLREANKLPTGEDFEYFHQFPEFDEIAKEENLLVQGLLGKLSKFFTTPLVWYDDIEQAANICLSNVNLILTQVSEPLGLNPSLKYTLEKPQNSIKSLPDNGYSAFVPKILYKYHAKVDVPAGILKAQQLRFIEAREDKVDTTEGILNPYTYELDNFSYLESQFLPQMSYFAPLESTPYEYINDEQSFYRMIQELRQSNEIAVDLENHSIRSYQGFCCLVQISTRTKDYIIDPFPLSAQMPVLGVILSDPSIVKVFHGSDMDIE